MKTIKKILYATDFSESADDAAAYALTLAKLAGASVHVLHVIGELMDNRKSQIQPEAFAMLEKNVEVQTVKEMEDFCQSRFGEQIPYTSEVVIGTPFQQIIEKAKAFGADLIVMGTHGRTGIEHVIVGSTAERVVRRSKIPVLTVQQQAN